MTAKKVVNVVAILCLVYSQSSRGREIPMPEISLPQCKIYKRSEMPESCKAKFPLLAPSQYTTALLNSAARLTYSVLWGASYTDTWNTKAGGHPAIDVPTALGTPVNAIGDGKVVKAQALPGYGNNVTIEHLDGTGKVYSSYSHLDTIEVAVGATVTQGQRIGTVGKSGNSDGPFGYHLDLQIIRDINLKGPYGYGNCADGYINAVNKGTCRDQLKAATIDPLVFFAEKGVVGASTLEELQKKITTTVVPLPLKIAEQSTTAAGSLLFRTTPPANTSNIPAATLGIQNLFHTVAATEEKSELPALNSATTPTQTSDKAATGQTSPTIAPSNAAPVIVPAAPLLSFNQSDGWFSTNDGKYRIKIKIVTPYIYEGETNVMELLIQDKNGNPMQGVLAYPIKVSVGNNTIDLFPSTLSFIQDGKKSIRMTGENPGKDVISITYNLEEVTNTEVIVSD